MQGEREDRHLELGLHDLHKQYTLSAYGRKAGNARALRPRDRSTAAGLGRGINKRREYPRVRDGGTCRIDVHVPAGQLLQETLRRRKDKRPCQP